MISAPHAGSLGPVGKRYDDGQPFARLPIGRFDPVILTCFLAHVSSAMRLPISTPMTLAIMSPRVQPLESPRQ